MLFWLCNFIIIRHFKQTHFLKNSNFPKVTKNSLNQIILPQIILPTLNWKKSSINLRFQNLIHIPRRKIPRIFRIKLNNKLKQRNYQNIIKPKLNTKLIFAFSNIGNFSQIRQYLPLNNCNLKQVGTFYTLRLEKIIRHITQPHILCDQSSSNCHLPHLNNRF